MTNIFISYRWGDSKDITGRIHDSLNKHFGEDRIFFDVKGIELGENIPQAVERTVKQCKILLPIIGKTWATIPDDTTGKPRLEDPGDQVRLEISTAFKIGLWVIPVLVNDASMPHADELPDDIAPITELRAAEIRHTDFDHGVEVLVEGIEKIFDREIEKERTVIQKREGKIAEIENAIKRAIDNKRGLIVGRCNVYCYHPEVGVEVEAGSLTEYDFNENLGGAVRQGWSIVPEKLGKGYSILLTRTWDISQTALREIAEAIIYANQVLRTGLESMDIDESE